MIYFDNNASTKPFDECFDELIFIKERGLYGNPSSAHIIGMNANKYINNCRENIVEFFGLDTLEEKYDVYFTSGGSESNNWICRHFALHSDNNQIFSTKLEHSSISNTWTKENIEIQNLHFDQNGIIDLDFVQENVKNASVFTHWVNSETGIIQPIEELAEICQENNNLLAVDAAQAVGKLSIDLDNTPIDLLSFSGHKFHSFKGIGCLLMRNGKKINLSSFISGGSQQNDLRAGTENLAGIATLAKACEIRKMHFAEHEEKMRNIRDYFEDNLMKISDQIVINGSSNKRVCNTSSILFPSFIKGEELVSRLRSRNICCSQGSACHSKSKSPSKVLSNLGFNNQEAWNTIRFSFSIYNTQNEANECLNVIQNFMETNGQK